MIDKMTIKDLVKQAVPDMAYGFSDLLRKD